MSARNGTLPISGTVTDFDIADNKKITHKQTSLLWWLFGTHLKYSWMSFSDLSMSALSVRLYRQQLLLEIVVRMR